MKNSYDFDQRSKFPALVLYKGGDLTVYESAEGLLICRTVDIKAGQHGRFSRATIVDLTGTAWEMDGAIKVKRLGGFWRHVLPGQLIRVQPTFVSPPKIMQMEDVKQRTTFGLRKRDGVTLCLRNFCTNIEHAEALRMIPSVESASSVSDIIYSLLGMDYPEKCEPYTPT
jgi:hypothetical protein